MRKKIRCFTVKSDYDGDDVKVMKKALKEFGLHVDLGDLECQDSHNPDCQVVVSDLPLTKEELAEIREFWPPDHDWSKPTPDSVNNGNDVKG